MTYIATFILVQQMLQNIEAENENVCNKLTKKWHISSLQTDRTAYRTSELHASVFI